MARVTINYNSATAPNGLHPFDVSLAALSLELFSYLCALETGEISSQNPAGIKIEEISFSNPLDIKGFLANVVPKTASLIVGRLLFYTEEQSRREINNRKSEQELLTLKIENLERLIAIRESLISNGMTPELATRILAKTAVDCGLTFEVQTNRGGQSMVEYG